LGRASSWPASDHFRHLVTPRDISLFRQHAAARHQQRSKLLLGQHGLPCEEEFKLGLVVRTHLADLLQRCLARQQIETQHPQYLFVLDANPEATSGPRNAKCIINRMRHDRIRLTFVVAGL
jgi:uncharacterized lipoprotein YbaY